MATATAPAPEQVPELIPTVSPWKRQPSAREVCGIGLLGGLIFVVIICVSQNYFAKVDNFGDSASYMEIASAIRHWDFRGLTVVEHFWGLPYFIAGLSMLTGLSYRASLLVISVAASFASLFLVRQLWGGWVAALFAVVSFDWLQRSYLGGSEPLFAALLFSSFLAMRRQRWVLAALLASLATVCRPLGLFALLGIGVTLLWKREFVKCAAATTTGAAIGTAYALPLWRYFGSPLANVHGYNPEGKIFGFPFYAIIKGTILYSAPWTSLTLSFAWILVVSAAVIVATSKSYRAYVREFPVENIFAALYLLSVYCYNYPYWARGSFPRFVIPVIPFVLFAFLPRIPKDRRLLWALAIIMPALAAISAIGLRSVLASVRGFF
jgi:hypothetical protein